MNLSRTQIKKSFEDNLIFCDNNIIKPKYLLNNGDVLKFTLLEPASSILEPHKMSLEILFEDEYIIIINKSAGIIVHTGNGISEPTLVEGVLAHCQLSKLGGDTRPGVVHRLDKDTTGAIIFAKTDEAYLKLVKMFSEHEIKKQYIAVVCGNMTLSSGIINKPIGRHKIIKTKMCVRNDGKPALTEWKLIKSFGKKFSLLKINLHTGRTHQIRVHCSSINHPLLGDLVYGYNPNFDKNISLQQPLLHAQRIQFLHPITQEEIKITAPLPENFKKVINNLKIKTSM